MMHMEPPEPLCPRCKDYISEDDEKYCPHCWEELDFEKIHDAYTLICPNCNRYVKEDEIAWRCGKCGFDGRERKCCACGKVLPPDEDDLCNSCQMEELRQQMEDPNFWDEFDNYYAGTGGQD